jgi:hypothetical protein
MPPKKTSRSLVAKVEEASLGELSLIADEIRSLLDEPQLPLGHPDASQQRQAKEEAEAASELLGRKIWPLMKLCHQELLKFAEFETEGPKRSWSSEICGIKAMGASNASPI